MNNKGDYLKASVVMATYNGEKFIEEQLKSIIRQSRPVDEIIICDDGSTDRTAYIAESVLGQSGINHTIIVNENNLGVTKNFEKAILLATGDIIFFSDQDDVWFEDKVCNHLNAYETENVRLVFSDAVLFNENGIEKKTAFDRFDFNKRLKLFRKDQLHCLMKGWFVTGATMSTRRNFAVDNMPFPDVMLHDQWLSAIAASVDGLYLLPEPQTKYRQHSGQLVGAAKGKILPVDKCLVNVKKEIERYEKLAIDIPACKEEIMNKISWFNERSRICSKNVFRRFFVGLKFLMNGGYAKYAIRPFRAFANDVLRAAYKLDGYKKIR